MVRMSHNVSGATLGKSPSLWEGRAQPGEGHLRPSRREDDFLLALIYLAAKPLLTFFDLAHQLSNPLIQPFDRKPNDG